MPISKHPLFPAMVALWFAALFGLGSLAIRPTLLESFVLALRLDLVVPAAAPPLGITSRILLALMMFVIGAAIGFTMARKIARSGSQPAQARTMRASAASYKDDVADDEDFNRLSAARPADSSKSSAYQLPGRRRALAMEEDYVNDYRDHAPLPGHEPQILDLATLGSLSEYTGSEETVPAEAEAVSEPLRAAPQEPAFDPWNRHTPEVKPAEHRADDVQIDAVPVETPAAYRAFDVPAEPEASAPEVSVVEPAPAEPMDFRRPAFAAPEDVAGQPVAPWADVRSFDPAPAPRAFEPEPEPVPVVAVAAEQPLQPVGLGLMPRDAVEKLTSAPLASLGVVQLAERLALAIARRKAPGEDASATAAPLAFVPPVPVVPQSEAVVAEPQEFAEPDVAVLAAPELAEEDVAEAEPAPFAEPAPAPATFIPRAMRPLHFDDSDHDDDDVLESILPPRRFAMPAPAAQEAPPVAAPAEPEAVAAAPAEEDENFASLLGMKPSLRQSFVRVDEPVEPEAPVEPVVIFPGQAPRFASLARPFEGPNQPAPAPFAVESPAPTPIEAGRRFDAPTAMPASMMGSSPSAASAIDPEETERALKAALATLQRMSGAA